MSLDIAVLAADVSDAAMVRFNQYMESIGLTYTLEMPEDWRTNGQWMVADQDAELALELDVWACDENFEIMKDQAMGAQSRYFQILLSVGFGFESFAFYVGAGLAFALNARVLDKQCIASNPFFTKIMKDIPAGTGTASEGLYDMEYALLLANFFKAKEKNRTG